ncbi:tRNA (guanine37-N(1)-) methyltransferase [Desulfobotulus alkaliphilus]|uniref:tRNA (guanine-N(1)-)-methyltransferase n=1 Tax=Desulfobotulus alkaliphilus TaxID=622671 RepID=A0A562RX98_9BACT|nr:tRNA (guanosine(37)-N1)-methyltransferase TrmD [Desulfobotulus alkaliphilus]TWI73274.1 tRNA (guanine37-N(1)-) methyltransferase [Desulfobotulus alkaliphilus]
MNPVSSLQHYAALSIFPEMFDGFWSTGMVRRAIMGGFITGRAVDLRAFAEGVHKVTDDKPYGGGCGMVMKPEPLMKGIAHLRAEMPGVPVLAMTPQGQPFTQSLAEDLAREKGMIMVCGRYEGMDERACIKADMELSIGDYVLTGGELAAMVVMDAVIRLIPGVLGGEESAEKESFSEGLIEYAHYTRPPVYEGMAVPDVLLSGNHKAIASWRLETSLKRTFLKRPDLLEDRSFSREERSILQKWSREIARLADN